MNRVIKDIFSKLMFNILKNYLTSWWFIVFTKIIKIEKAKELVDNLRHKSEYVIHIRNSKHALNHEFN